METHPTPARDAAHAVMQVLVENGFEAYLVGGCVRDLLLYREPKDYDVTTNATPEQIMRVFPKTIPVGAAFGVVVVVHNEHQIEVATYRADGDYSDGRRPDSVVFSAYVDDDVTRRDFTINGMLMSNPADSGSVRDMVGGQEDLELGVIRAIGDPRVRFAEDKLRMLRAVRFASQLGFTIEAETLAAIREMAHLITQVSRERIREELFKLVMGVDPISGLTLLATTGLARHIFPEGFLNRGFLTLQRFAIHKPNNPVLGIAMLLADQDYDVARHTVESLKLTNIDAAAVLGALIVQLSLPKVVNADRAERIMLARRVGFDLGLALFHQNMEMTRQKEVQRTVGSFYDSLPVAEIRPLPLVNGDDLIAFGLKPGVKFGLLLQMVETRQLNQELTTREAALQFLRELASL